MPGLNTSLLTALQALMAQQGAINATTNNIANVNTPGYSRQVPIFDEAPPVLEGNVLYGSGVVLERFTSIRDQLLDTRIQEETSQQGNFQAQQNALAQIQPLFTSSGQDIGSMMSAFFTSLSKLSADPSNVALRQAVLTSARNLASSFHSTAAGLLQVQSALNGTVQQDVGRINQLSKQIADLNTQLLSLHAAGQDGGTVKDQQTELIRQLSQLTNVSVIATEQGGETITTGNGIALVVGGQSFALATTTGANGMQSVLAQGVDITSSLRSGDLGGTLQVRDEVIPSLGDQLDTLAYQFTNSFNTLHANGYDLNGTAGGDFFAPIASSTGAAVAFAVSITDPRKMAASSDGSAGSNGNLTAIIALQNTAFSSGQSPTDTFANLVFQVGSLASNATTENQASSLSLQQLGNQRSALSGVSIDEETTNLIRYQQAYQAAAQVINVINQLTQIAINLGGNT